MIVLVYILAQLFIFISWQLRLRRHSVHFWQKNLPYFINTMLLMLLLLILYKANYHLNLSNSLRTNIDFEKVGRRILELTFMLSLIIRMTYFFIVDERRSSKVREINSMLNISTSIFVLGMLCSLLLR